MAIPYSRTIVGSLPWYSVLVVSGIVLAIWLAAKEEKRLGLKPDTVVDLALVTVPFGIVGARIYYVAMRWQDYAANPLSVLYIWQGGMAIYGAVLGGALGVFLFAHRRKLSPWKLGDLIAPGLLLAQAVGRWGNYFNMEAYGPQITEPALQFFPLSVLIPSGTGYQWHAATFFYESIWNFCGFIFLWWMRKAVKGDGNLFAWYLVVYGSGRFIIEQLRQDSLYIGPFRASQYLSLALCTAAALVLLWRSCKEKNCSFASCAVPMLLWLARWLCLSQPVGYAVMMVAAGVSTLWLIRDRRKAIGLLAMVIAVDGAGLMMALAGWPVSASLALGMHALLCSITVPVVLMILCMM